MSQLYDEVGVKKLPGGGGGGGSVTSAAHVSLASTVSTNTSAIAANSAQMTSADNAISNAVSIVSVAQAATSAAVTSVNAVNSNQASAIGANSAQMTSADNAISNAVSIVSQAVSVVSAAQAVTSAAVTTNSAQMTSADNAISNAVSIVSQAVSVVSAAQAVTSAAVTSLNAVVSNRTSAITTNSAQMTSADNAISNAVSIVSAAHASLVSVVSAISQRLSALVLDSIANVSAGSPTSGQVLKFNSAAAQWVASTDATGGGGGSVTSTEASAISAAAASADNTLSVRIDSVMSVASQALSVANNAVSATSNYASVASQAASAASHYASVASQAASVASNAASVAVANAPIVRIVSNTQSTNGSALVDISGLVLTIAADQTWEVNGMLLVSTSVATAGLKAGCSVGGGHLSLPRYMRFFRVSTGQSAGVMGGAGLMQVSGTSQFLSLANLGGVLAGVDYTAVFNVGSAGTFRMQFAGVASTAASPVHIMPGSYFKAVRLK